MHERHNLFTIGEFSKITGMGIHSLRYYDEIGALKPEYVDPVSNYRYYSFDQLRRVPAINMCKEAGIKLSEFGSFVDNGNINYVKIISDSRDAIDRKIEEYRLQKEELNRAEQLLSLRSSTVSGEARSVPFSGHPVWLMPYDSSEHKDNEAGLLVKLSSHAKRRGYQISPVCFCLIRFGTGNESRQYAFSALNCESSPHESSDHIYRIGDGQFIVQACSSCSLDEAEQLLGNSPDCDCSTLLSFVFLGEDDQNNTYFAAARRI
jgi:DNA-binding transcriptional MerR regulator